MNNRVYLALGATIFIANVLYYQFTDTTITSIDIKDAVFDLVDQTPASPVVIETQANKIKYTKKEFDCLARNIYWEAGTEDIVGKFAVAQVTVNRLKIGFWGKNICSVVYAPAQFSWTTVKRRAWLALKGNAWADSVDVADQVLNYGMQVTTLKHSLFYHADYVDPKWRDNSKRITKVGRHIFYTQAKGSTLKL